VITVLKTHRPHQSRNKSTRPATRNLLTGGAGALLATLALCAGGTATAAAAECPNEQLRAENNSTTLPDCRAYEQVTPTYKQGISLGTETGGFAFASNLEALADGGDGVSYTSIGNFSNNGQDEINAYFAKRTPSGWMTVAAQPSAAEYYGAGRSVARTPNLETGLFGARRPTDPSNSSHFYLGNVDGAVTEIGPAIPLAATTHPPGIVTTRPNAINSRGAAFDGASEDLSDVTFFEADHEVNFPGDELTGEQESLLEYVGAEGRGPQVVSVNNQGKEFDSCGVGHSSLISRDGRIIAFEQAACEGQVKAVYARVGDETTVDLSSSQCTRASSDPGGACNEPSGATLAGGSPNGSITYFITSQQLVNSDIDQGRDLYACILPAGAIAPHGDVNSCPDLEPISVTGTAAGANVPEVDVAGGETEQERENFLEMIHVSKDGSHVTFTATGVLTGTSTNGDGQHALEGAENVYTFNHDAPVGKRLKFVGDLCSGSGISGSVADPLCPQSPSANDAARATFKQGPYMQMTADGHYLVFATYARLGAGDTDEGQDVYRYDTETGSLVRISIGQDGYDDNGNATNANAWIEQEDRAPRLSISENGEQVFFTTPEALVPQDSNGVNDVYEWENGQVYLISDGVAPGGSVLWTVNPSGENVLFSTAEQLTSSDGDTAWDVYDARVEGGFPVPPASVSCSGEACQGSPPTAGALPSPGSATLTGGGNLTTAFSAGSSSPLTVSAAKTITGPGGTLSVELAGRGRVVISGSGLKSTSVSVTKAGAVTVKVLLTNQARAKLRKRHTVRISAKVIFTPASGQASTAAVALTFKQAHSSKSASKARKGHS
jgi:hypothetical protein